MQPQPQRLDRNRYQVGLDIFLKADDLLTIPKLEQAAIMAGASEVTVEGHGLTALFASGLTLWTVDRRGYVRLAPRIRRAWRSQWGSYAISGSRGRHLTTLARSAKSIG